MSCLLDTNAVIAVLKNQPPAVRRRLRRAASKGHRGRDLIGRAVRALVWGRALRTPPRECRTPARFPLGFHRCRFPSMKKTPR